MILQEAVESGKDFKFGERGRWLYVHKSGVICYKNTILPAQFSEEEVLRSRWIVKEEWYEGDFKAKHPNGVFCKVTLSNSGYTANLAVTDYCKGEGLPFKAGNCGAWRFAKPISPKNAPDIIGKED